MRLTDGRPPPDEPGGASARAEARSCTETTWSPCGDFDSERPVRARHATIARPRPSARSYIDVLLLSGRVRPDGSAGHEAAGYPLACERAVHAGSVSGVPAPRFVDQNADKRWGAGRRMRVL
jgi:hypothetical protein